MATDIYSSPLSERYASREMQFIFSQDMKFRTWRKLWIALAETEKELGLKDAEGNPRITEEQIEELKKYQDDINYEVAREREKIVRHDVMSHVYAYGQQCPGAAGIIHLGATSCYVGDNTDVILMREGLRLIRKKLINVIHELSGFAMKYRTLPTLAFTHFQPAQPTTVGKRATLWIQELMMDLEDLDYVLGSLKLLGSKGTTGTQASFLELFDGDEEKCRQADRMIAEKMGFEACFPVSGQTYSRKLDTRVVNVLAGIAASAHKFSNDIRLLQHLKEVEEPFEKGQIGSSAMAYKRNPMRSERIASLSRYVMIDALNPAITSATQWFERTLDDSANKRLSVAEGFLATDGILDLYLNVVDGLVVYEKVITKHLMAELPFMATENIMMDAVKAGGNRQELHERIRELSMEAGANVKEKGLDNNLLELIAGDDSFPMGLGELEESMNPSRYVGRAPGQVEEFIRDVVQPVLDENKDILGIKAEINV
ncbi:MAG: adenylosuccinate lyase [Eubacterium sp.]|nr:adenylosuccinate lyase [Eubacterium sp.]